MRRLVILVALIVGATVIYRTAFPSVTVRYRLTLEVQYGNQRRIGSGVTQITYRKNLRLLGAAASSMIDVEGDAVSVDLDTNDSLFALLKPSQNPRSGPDYVIPVLFGVTTGGVSSEDFERIGKLKGSREVPSALLPLMVRLRSLSDPKSAELFDPNRVSPDLKLTRAMIEIVPTGFWPLNALGITGVPISRGIEIKLPWLVNFRGYSGGQFNPDWSRPEKSLTGSDFVRR